MTYRREKNPNWRGGKSLKRNYPCPKCGKPLMRQERYASLLCRKCSVVPKFNKKKWYKDLRTKLKTFAFEYKGSKCARCGVSDLPLRCFAFHHLDPKTKEIAVGLLFRVGNYEKIKQELDKCIMVCHNCHAIIHDEDANALEI